MIAFSGFGAVGASSALALPPVHRLMDSVIPMQIGKNGVNGPAQNTRQADAMTDAHFQPNTA